MSDSKKCKVGFCKCGIRVTLMSSLPHGDTDRGTLKEFAALAKEGCRIDYIPVNDARELFGGCFGRACWKKAQSKENTNHDESN